jgi:predicted phosphate transport protein (TIGR00153 family)
VRLRLTPQDNSFFDMLTESANNLVLGAEAVAKLFVDGADRQAISEEVRRIEHAEDEVTHGILRKLNVSFVTPFDRDDIYQLAGRLDDVMDYMEAAVDLVVLYKLGDLPEVIAEQVDVLRRAALLTAESMPRLRTRKDLDSYWIEINRLENEADQLYRRLLAKLFDGSFDAITVMKLKEIAEQLEAAADAFEDVANSVETIVIKES